MNNVPFTPCALSARAHPMCKRPVLRHLTTLVVAIGAISLVACDDPEWSSGVVTGKIDFGDATWRLPEIPETATVGVPVEITVWTGGSGCYEYYGTFGGVDGLSAWVRPDDLFIVGRCSTDDREFVEHTTTRIFEEPGTAEITIHYTDAGAVLRQDHNGDQRKVYTLAVSPAG